MFSSTLLQCIALKEVDIISQYTSVETESLKGYSFKSFDKYKLITYFWARNCAKDCAYFTAKITGQEKPGLDQESLTLNARIFLLNVTYFREITQKFRY